MSSQQSRPRAWPEWFVVRAMGDECLVYDLRTQQVTSLNAFATRVWRACDGTADADVIAARLTAEGETISDIRAIDLALEMLNKAGLVEAQGAPSRRFSGRGRREFVRRLLAGGAAAAAATPAVVSILAPAPAEAASGCNSNSQCAAPTPICNPDSHQCVECLNSENCEDPAKPVCQNFVCTDGGFRSASPRGQRETSPFDDRPAPQRDRGVWW